MPTALITGASSGLGAEFARQLAPKGYDLLLTARSQAPLEQLATTLHQNHGIRAEVVPLDLAQADAPTQLTDAARDRQMQIDFLVNNAGFGDYGEFASRDRQKQLSMVQLNVTALVDLTYQVLPSMQQRRSGTILNVGSIAGFQPLPYLSVYAASKAFVLSFSEALWVENQDYGVRVFAVCPGPTATNFVANAGMPGGETPASSSQAYASAETVVREALQACDRDTGSVVVGGASNHIITTLPRLLPRDALVKAVGTQFRPSESPS